MKIAFLCHNIFSDGGVQRVMTTVSNMLSEKNQIDIICTNTKIKIDKEKYRLKEKNIKILYKNIEDTNIFSKLILKSLRALNQYTSIFNNEKLYKLLAYIYYPNKQRNRIINIINENKYDVVIGCEGYYGILMGIINEKVSAKTISWNHNSYEAYLKTKYKYYWNRDILFEKYLNKVDDNIVLTNSDKQKYLNNLRVKSRVIYNPLSFKMDKKSDLKSNIIIAVGRLTRQKGFDNLIKSFTEANNKCSDKWNLWIVGDGIDKNHLIEIVKKCDMDKYVQFIPFTNNIEEYFIKASIYAMSSRWEGFGLVVTEAMEAGLPVVSFDISGPKEILDKYGNSNIVKSNDINAFSQGLYDLMSNYEKRKQYSQNGLKRVSYFYSENIMKIWENMLYNLWD
ncbi:MAG: glycosyltransferase [Paraclostridium sordellii]